MHMISRPKSIFHAIETNSFSRPNATALLSTDGAQWSFDQLRTQTERLASQIQSRGVEHEQRIAVVLPNGPQMALAFLGVASVAACAPMNPGILGEECVRYLADLNARALIVAEGEGMEARQAAESLDIPVWDLLKSGESGYELQETDANPPVVYQPRWSGPEEIALVLHTSGTTSRPKQVPLTQCNLLTSAHNIGTSLQLNETDRLLNMMPLFHIHGLVAGLLAPIVAGGSIVCTPGFSAPDFAGWLTQFSPTWYTAVPTMQQAVLAALSNHPRSVDHHLRFIRSSSAWLPPKLMSDLEERFGVPVIEAYGMTEASHQMTSNPLPPLQRKPGSVGMAAGLEVAIMDERSAELLDIGATGEIVIRGKNVTRGYVDNPAANAAAFVGDWFRTGDQGAFDGDGYLFITGRLKETINRGGENIAPREIDEVLLSHPAVAQAVTFAVPHVTLGEDVAVAVTLHEGVGTSARDLRQFAFERMSDSKVPTQILLVDDIPKGPTGKLQRIGLAEALSGRLRPAFVAPTDPVEETLAAIWSEVLKVAQVGVYDNFFSLGGDSISATQVVARVHHAFDIELPLSAVFREPILFEQASIIIELLLDEIEELS